MLNKGEKFLKIPTSCKAFNRIRMLDFFFFLDKGYYSKEKKKLICGEKCLPLQMNLFCNGSWCPTGCATYELMVSLGEVSHLAATRVEDKFFL